MEQLHAHCINVFRGIVSRVRFRKQPHFRAKQCGFVYRVRLHNELLDSCPSEEVVRKILCSDYSLTLTCTFHTLLLQGARAGRRYCGSG